MKKVISMILATVMVIGLVSCKKAPGHRSSRKDNAFSWMKIIENDELPDDYEGIILTVRESNWGEVCSTEDYWVSSSYDIYNDGTIIETVNYNLSAPVVTERTLSRDDLGTVYDFRQWCINDEPFADYHEDACDGVCRSFGYYDENDEYVSIYSGYTYGNSDLTEIQDIVYFYFPSIDQ